MKNFLDKQKILLEILSLLSKILKLDAEENLTHGLRVANFSQAIAKQLSHNHPGQLFIAGLLHDIGGIGLPQSILHHALGDFQDMEAREHPTRGAEILRSFHLFQPLAGWVADHHERFDGTGFPEGKTKYSISSETGIIHLADHLDLFIRNNPETSLITIRHFLNQQSASNVDPVIVEAAKHCFSTQDKLDRHCSIDPNDIFLLDLETDFAGLNYISIPELITQLLWLIAQVADCKRTERTFHSNKVAFCCHRIAKTYPSMGIDPLQALWAGLIHDIGIHFVRKIPAPWPLKQQPKSNTQSSLYHQHPQVSADLISSIEVLKYFAPVLAAHHENWDGTGFPNNLKKKNVPLLSQVIAICVLYYEIITKKVQEGAQLSHLHALNELEQERGKIFSSQLLDKALPVLKTWGSRDISWMQDIKNVHAFFSSDPFGEGFQNDAPSVQEEDPKNSTFVPRQWQLAKLSSDFKVLEGAKGLTSLTKTQEVENFFDIIEPSVINKTRGDVLKLEDKSSLTLTLMARNTTKIEIIFIKDNNFYKLLYRGVNTTPLFTRKHSIFNQHFQNTPEASLLFDKDTVIIDVNNSALILLGFPEQNLIGKGIGTLFSPFLSKAQLNSLYMMLTEPGNDIWLEEFSIINNQGTPYTLQATIEPLPEHNAQQTYLCRLRDISDRKKMEKELLQRDRAMQLIVHNISGMTGEIFFRSLLQQFTALTKSKLSMVGELVNKCTELQPLAYREQKKFLEKEKFLIHTSPCKVVIKKGETFFPENVQKFFPEDTLLPEQNISSYWGLPLRNQSGEVIGVLVAMNDSKIIRSQNGQALTKVLQSLAGRELDRMQTERVLQENKQQLERQNQELIRMNQLKNDMIAVTSHDLKSPLSAIIGYANLLEQYFSTLPEEKKIYYIQRIEQEGNKQLRFINKLLDLYRIESGAIDLELVNDRLDLLVKNCISTQEHVAAERNISIHFHVEGEPLPISFDPLRMEQVISNILSNAIKFSSDDKDIDVYYKQDKRTAVVKICDNGPGIDEKEILHIFDRYYMGRTDFEIRPEGSGLGLYIVKNIINLHNGDVSASNRSTGGSNFTVWIPATSNGKEE